IRWDVEDAFGPQLALLRVVAPHGVIHYDQKFVIHDHCLLDLSPGDEKLHEAQRGWRITRAEDTPPHRELVGHGQSTPAEYTFGYFAARQDALVATIGCEQTGNSSPQEEQAQGHDQDACQPGV